MKKLNFKEIVDRKISSIKKGNPGYLEAGIATDIVIVGLATQCGYPLIESALISTLVVGALVGTEKLGAELLDNEAKKLSS